jgi:hypothetical protein
MLQSFLALAQFASAFLLPAFLLPGVRPVVHAASSLAAFLWTTPLRIDERHSGLSGIKGFGSTPSSTFMPLVHRKPRKHAWRERRVALFRNFEEGFHDKVQGQDQITYFTIYFTLPCI